MLGEGVDMEKSLFENKIAEIRSRYTKRLDKISKELRLGKTYSSLSKSQQKKVEKEYNNELSKKMVQLENFKYDFKLQKMTKIPIRAQKKQIIERSR